MLTFDISGAQIDGARDYQEDAFLITNFSDADGDGGSLVIVADGMGGHAAGNVASNMAVQTFNKHVTSNFPNDNLSEVLHESVRQANESIKETVRETAALKGMGCTLVAVVLEEKYIRWVSVGDSHLYLIRNQDLKKKNADHSYGGFLDRMAAEGTPVEPEAGFSRNMLMSALTGDEIAEIDCPETPLELEPGDRLIVASDGLDTLSHGKMLSFAAAASTAKECVEALLQGVEEAKMPRQDNTTIVVIDVGEKEDRTPITDATIPTTTLTDEIELEAPRPFVAEEEEDATSSGTGLIVTLVVLVLIGVAGGAYWFMTSGPSAGPDKIASVDIEQIGTIEITGEEVPPDVGIEEPLEADIEAPAEIEDVAAPTPDSEVVEATAIVAGEPFNDILKSGAAAPTMIWLPAGRFAMGARDSGAAFDERPQHNVTINKFAMSVHEITIAQYNQFARTTGRKPPKTGDLDAVKHPIFFVSWNDTLAYTKWLSAQTGKTYRLATEAEWEYAARAGTTTPYWWGRKLSGDHAHCFACETGLDPRHPTRVGRFAPNAFGLYDTAGNIEEWVYDCYNKNYQGAPDDGSVFEGGDCSMRGVRGGAYSSGPRALRPSARSKFRQNGSNDNIGIRIVREP